MHSFHDFFCLSDSPAAVRPTSVGFLLYEVRTPLEVRFATCHSSLPTGTVAEPPRPFFSLAATRNSTVRALDLVFCHRPFFFHRIPLCPGLHHGHPPRWAPRFLFGSFFAAFDPLKLCPARAPTSAQLLFLRACMTSLTSPSRFSV